MQAEPFNQFLAGLTPPNLTGINGTLRNYATSIYNSSKSCPFDTPPTNTTTGRLSTSNKHVPGTFDTTTWNRFFWVVQYAVGQGFYVTIDFHFEQEDLQNNATRFAGEWTRLWKDLTALPYYSKYLSGRVFPELANEWDKFGCKWETGVTGRRKWLVVH